MTKCRAKQVAHPTVTKPTTIRRHSYITVFAIHEQKSHKLSRYAPFLNLKIGEDSRTAPVALVLRLSLAS